MSQFASEPQLVHTSHPVHSEVPTFAKPIVVLLLLALLLLCVIRACKTLSLLLFPLRAPTVKRD